MSETCVIDTSVIAAALSPKEPHHTAALKIMAGITSGVIQTVQPSFFLVELGGIARRTNMVRHQILEVARDLSTPPNEIITIGPKRARQAMDIAMQCRLRGPDALFVWTAQYMGIPLYTFDDEILTRGGACCEVRRP